MSLRAAWVTGTGSVSGLGAGTASLWEGLLAGRTAARPCGELGLLVDGQEPWLSRAAGAATAGAPGAALGASTRQLAWEAILEACQQAHLLVDPAAPPRLEVRPERVGLVLGTTLADWHAHLDGDGARELRTGLGFTPEALAVSLAAQLGARGPVRTVGTACASGGAAIGLGLQLLRSGRADVVLAGGVDRLSPFVVAGFASLRALAPSPMRPFDRRRAGLNLGEGAAFMVLERPPARGEGQLGQGRARRPLARLAGAGLAADAFHPTAPARDGSGAARAMLAALHDAGLPGTTGADHVDLVIAHGTATPYNDPMEARALEKVLGIRAHSLPVTSTKSQLGHTLGAAAAFDALTAVFALASGRVPPVASAVDLEPDPEIPLAVVRGGPVPLGQAHGAAGADGAGHVLCTASGFGGTNSALVFTR
jgi:3-oxoacyl-[acyl-carrier-protein] synthase II